MTHLKGNSWAHCHKTQKLLNTVKQSQGHLVNILTQLANY